jgi:CBS domain containing-hemolysin-like protein
MLGIRNANEHLGLDLREDEDYATLAGFLMAHAGKVLTEGETVEIDRGVFRIERVDKRRIKQVRFTPGQIDSKLVLAPILFASLVSNL